MPCLWEPPSTDGPPDDAPMVLDAPIARVLAALVIAGLLLLVPGAARREADAEEAARRVDQARLEQHHPGALARLRALAAAFRQ